jgi:Leucine-rich repeat (LRR) protein
LPRCRRHNDLTELPNNIGQLSLLILLDVSGNALKVLPTSIGKLANLRTLAAADNE